MTNVNGLAVRETQSSNQTSALILSSGDAVSDDNSSSDGGGEANSEDVPQSPRIGRRVMTIVFHGSSSAYEEGKFCETFHLDASGWRCCESCGKQIHCGCIVSFHMFVLLDAGGIECITCARKSFILTPNPAWPPPSLFLPVMPERIKDLSTKTWRQMAGSGPVPWRQAPSLFSSSAAQSDLQPRMPFEVHIPSGIDRLVSSERPSASSLEKKKVDDSSARLMNGTLKLGTSETLENGNAGINCGKQANQELHGAVFKILHGADQELQQISGEEDRLGTFLAGALLAETNFRTQIEADIRPFRGLLLGLFFVTTGTSIDMQIDNVGMDTVMCLGQIDDVCMGSSRQQRNQKVWLLPPFTYDYKSEKYSSPKDYYAGIRAEWAFRVTEQEGLFNDLRNFGAPVPHRRSLTMARRNVSDYEKAVSRIKKENNRMLMRRCRHFMLQLATEMAEASNRDLTVIERNNVLNNEKYLSDYNIWISHDGLSSHVTWCTGSGSRRGGRNLQRGESSRREGGRGSGDAEDEPPFPLLDASCAYHDRFGKRHFVMPKYYRDPCGLVEDPSENQTGYGYAKARLLKWPALFIERVQNERLCRERRLKVPKARSVEIQKEDPDNVDRLCQTLQREISQMGRRLARDMQLLILKKDAQKNKTEPNVAAIKGIMEDPELVSDAELSDCSDSEPPVDLSAN
ncbi:unnamed protein product [Camellia sinensis]